MCRSMYVYVMYISLSLSLFVISFSRTILNGREMFNWTNLFLTLKNGDREFKSMRKIYVVLTFKLTIHYFNYVLLSKSQCPKTFGNYILCGS